jgi:hypothetical protein
MAISYESILMSLAAAAIALTLARPGISLIGNIYFKTIPISLLQ